MLVGFLSAHESHSFNGCRCCHAVELFAAACIRLGIPQQNQPLDPYTGEPVPDPHSNPYLPAVPQPLQMHLSAMLPGVHAMSNTKLQGLGQGLEMPGPDIIQYMGATPIARAVLKVCCSVLPSPGAACTAQPALPCFALPCCAALWSVSKACLLWAYIL